MTTRRLLRAVTLTVVLACVLPVPSAYACSCAVGPGGDAPLEGTVFYGRIASRVVEGQGAVYDVEVERVYAGETGSHAQVYTSAHGASCGLEIPGRGHAVFYTTKAEGRLTAHLCSGTRSASSPPTGLGDGYPPTVGTFEPGVPPPEAGGSGDGGSGSNALPVAAALVAVLASAVLVLAWRPTVQPPSPDPAA